MTVRARANSAPSNSKITDKGSSGELPWHERPFLTMQFASQVAGISTASLYRYASLEKLVLKRLAGRVLVQTSSLERLLESAEDWSPTNCTSVATKRRIERSRASWEAA